MAISRYQNNQTKKTPDGKTVYKSKRLKKIPLKNNDIYVATQTGDRLDLLINIMVHLLTGGLLLMLTIYMMVSWIERWYYS